MSRGGEQPGARHEGAGVRGPGGRERPSGDCDSLVLMTRVSAEGGVACW
jgi:hypothetical protein